MPEGTVELVKEDLAQIQDSLDDLALLYNKGILTSDTAAQNAYEVLLRHPAARAALDWFATTLIEDAEAVGIKVSEVSSG